MHITLQRYFGIFTLTLAAFLQAEEYSYSCRHNACCVDDFQIRASVLILKPTIDQNSYVISSTNNRFGGEVYPDGERHLVKSEYDAGFRIETLCPIWPAPKNVLNLRFAYLDANNSSDTTGPFLFDTVGYPGHGAQAPEDTTYNGTAKMRHQYLYYGADATINRPLFDECFDNLTLLFGLHYSYIKFRQKFLSEGTYIVTDEPLHTVSNRFRIKSTFWGIGPEVGIDYNYLLPCFRACGDIGLNANFRGMLLASENNSKLQDITTRTGPVGVNVKNKHAILRINPAFHAQLGLNYAYAGDCCNTFFEIGYEFNWYSKSINKITSYDVAFAGDTIDAFEDLCLQGPFIRLNVSF